MAEQNKPAADEQNKLLRRDLAEARRVIRLSAKDLQAYVARATEGHNDANVKLAWALDRLRQYKADETRGDEALLANRKASAPQRIDNARLPAGSPMHYYCASCGHQTAVLPEDWWREEDRPPKFCGWCYEHGFVER